MSARTEDLGLKQELINKAIEVFSKKGYKITNLTDITDWLGVSRGPVYYHFKDKYGLFYAAYDLWEKEYTENMNRILQQEKHIIKILEDIIYHCTDLYQRYRPVFFSDIQSLPELSDIKNRYNRLLKEMYNKKVELVKQAIAKGEIRQSIDPEVVVDILYTICSGISASIERPVASLHKSRIDTVIAAQLLGIERLCCD